MFLGSKIFNNKVAVIEPSGSHSGMQYYNHGMRLGLHSNEIQSFLFTDNSVCPSGGDSKNIYNYFNKVWVTRVVRLRMYYFLINLMKSVVMAKKNHCDLVHLHQFHLDLQLLVTVAFCRLFFKKVVLTVHDVESFDEKSKLSSSIVRFFMSKMVDKVCVHNAFSFSVLPDRFKSKSVIIKHGNYIPFFRDLPIRGESEGINLLFFGLIKESKGLDVLLGGLLILKDLGIDFHLTIAGRPWRNNFKQYENFIAENNLGNSISCFLSFISEDDLVRHFASCDLVVLPYKKIYQSGVALKAMSLKRPILCSSLPAFEELIIDGVNGFIFESESSSSLALKIKEIIPIKSQLKDIVNTAFKDLEEYFSWESIGFELKKNYKEIYEN